MIFEANLTNLFKNTLLRLMLMGVGVFICLLAKMDDLPILTAMIVVYCLNNLYGVAYKNLRMAIHDDSLFFQSILGD